MFSYYTILTSLIVMIVKTDDSNNLQNSRVITFTQNDVSPLPYYRNLSVVILSKLILK
jgi:hypothetical protein